jgi:hypothetical protein
MSRASTDREVGRVADGAPSAVSRSTLMVLRRVLNAYREGWLLEERLTAAACMTAEDARARGLAAGGMIVALKDEWAMLDAAQLLPRHARQALLDRLVSDAIRAYYRADDAPPDAATVGWGAAARAGRASTAA